MEARRNEVALMKKVTRTAPLPKPDSKATGGPSTSNRRLSSLPTTSADSTHAKLLAALAASSSSSVPTASGAEASQGHGDRRGTATFFNQARRSSADAWLGRRNTRMSRTITASRDEEGMVRRHSIGIHAISYAARVARAFVTNQRRRTASRGRAGGRKSSTSVPPPSSVRAIVTASILRNEASGAENNPAGVKPDGVTAVASVRRAAKKIGLMQSLFTKNGVQQGTGAGSIEGDDKRTVGAGSDSGGDLLLGPASGATRKQSKLTHQLSVIQKVLPSDLRTVAADIIKRFMKCVLFSCACALRCHRCESPWFSAAGMLALPWGCPECFRCMACVFSPHSVLLCLLKRFRLHFTPCHAMCAGVFCWISPTSRKISTRSPL